MSGGASILANCPALTNLYCTSLKNIITLHYCTINIQHVSPRRIISLVVHKEHLDTSIDNPSELVNLHLLV